MRDLREINRRSRIRGLLIGIGLLSAILYVIALNHF